MTTVRKIYESDETGTVHVDVAVGGPHRKVEVVVEWRDVADATPVAPVPARRREWIYETAGSIDDPTFVRHPQPNYDQRDEID